MPATVSILKKRQISEKNHANVTSLQSGAGLYFTYHLQDGVSGGPVSGLLSWWGTATTSWNIQEVTNYKVHTLKVLLSEFGNKMCFINLIVVTTTTKK